MAPFRDDGKDNARAASSSDPGLKPAEAHDVLSWEEWDKRRPFWHHATAGSCAGVAEHVLMYPLDNIKTNLQAFSPSTSSQSAAAPRFRDVYRQLSSKGVVR